MRNDEINRKLIGYIDKILTYCGDTNEAAFSENTQLVEACVFNLSQMGELVGRLDEDFLIGHPDIPWRSIRGLRNRIVHDYEGVNLTLVWDVIADDLPVLRVQLLSM